jgi:hypothetical protein
MADEEPSTVKSAPQVERQVLWLAIIGMAALLLLALAALGMAFFLGRNQPLISITAGNNSQTSSSMAPAPPPATPPPAARPDKGGEPGAHRMSGAIAVGPDILPDALALQDKREAAPPLRADTQSPPYYSTLSPVAKVLLRVRLLPNGPQGLRGPVPFRMHEWQPGSDGRVASVEASVPGAGPSDDQELYSFLPEVDYKSSAGKGHILSLKVGHPRKTSLVNALRAPKGFQFLVAEIRAGNLSQEPISLDPDMFEVQDSDHVPYLVNPELLSADFPQAPIAPGEAGTFIAAFLVPSDASLQALVAREPGDGLISSPLKLQ